MIEEARSRANAMLLLGDLATVDFRLIHKAVVESPFKSQAITTARPQQWRSYNTSSGYRLVQEQRLSELGL